MRLTMMLLLTLAVAACARTHTVGEQPELSPQRDNAEYRAMMSPEVPLAQEKMMVHPGGESSLWTRGRGSLLGDRRAMNRGDILTVVIEIDDKAEMNNSSARSRNGNEQMKVGALFGLPQKVEQRLPGGASLSPGVDFGSSSDAQGQGKISRNEKLTLRVAVTVVGVQPNGILVIEGRQEVRVNYEIRELWVSGFVRPEDVSRQNEITYDKIAAARISYGGRGQISEMQQPRYGQQLADALLPF